MSGLPRTTLATPRRKGVPLWLWIQARFPVIIMPVAVAAMLMFARDQQMIRDLDANNYDGTYIASESSTSTSESVPYNSPATATRPRIINFRWDLDIMMDGARNFDSYYAPWSWGLAPDWRIDEEEILACRTQTERKTTFPLVSGDGFRCLADVLVDETTEFKMKIQTEQYASDSSPEKALQIFNTATFTQEIDEEEVLFHPVVFVKSDRDQQGQFFKDFQGNFSRPYVLVTHNSDIPIPSRASLKYTDDSNLVHWFGQNKQVSYHQKIWSIPIGFSNRRWGPSFSAELYERAARAAMHMQKEKKFSNDTDKLLLASFTPRTESRSKAIEYAKKQWWATVNPLSYDQYQDAKGSKSADELHFSYLMDVAQYKFAFSPKGNGLDCHRTYELLLLGVIPIIEESSINEIFMPPNVPLGSVIIIRDWEEVTLELLKNHWGVYKPSLLEKRISGDLADPIIPKILTLRHWMNLVWDKARIDD